MRGHLRAFATGALFAVALMVLLPNVSTPRLLIGVVLFAVADVLNDEPVR